MKVRVIPTEVHGALDYLASAANLAFPRLLGLGDEPSAVLVARIDGLAGAGSRRRAPDRSDTGPG